MSKKYYNSLICLIWYNSQLKSANYTDTYRLLKKLSFRTPAELVDTSVIKKVTFILWNPSPWKCHEITMKVVFWKFMGFNFVMKKKHFKNEKGKRFWAALILEVTLAIISKRQSSVWTNHKHRVWKLSQSQTLKFDTLKHLLVFKCFFCFLAQFRVSSWRKWHSQCLVYIPR